MRRLLPILLLVLAFPACAADHSARVVGIADGDTITVLTADKTQHRIRLWGIDAPATGQDFGSRAKQAASELAFRKQVTIRPRNTDRYGRTVAEVIHSAKRCKPRRVKQPAKAPSRACQMDQVSVASVTPAMRRADRVQSHFCGTSAQAILKNLGWRFCTVAKLVYGMNQSLDGYVNHLEFRPSPALFRHFIEQVRDLTGSVYGRRMYEVMRYWDEDCPDWGAAEHDFAAAWRSQPKWVVSRTLKSVGPNATLVEDDIEAVIRGLKAQSVGEIEVAGPDLAGCLTKLGLIDEYQLYLHPIVLGRGKPFFSGPRPPLRLVTSDFVGEDVIRLTYVPA